MAQPGEDRIVSDIVNAYKKEGKFDERRKNAIAKIISSDLFSNAIAEIDETMKNIVSNAQPHMTKNNVREIMRGEMKKRLAKRLEQMVFEEIGTDEHIRDMLSEIERRVGELLGLTEPDLDQKNENLNVPSTSAIGKIGRKQSNASSLDENHQVCDMEIETDSEPGQPAINPAHSAVLDIELPPNADPPSPAFESLEDASGCGQEKDVSNLQPLEATFGHSPEPCSSDFRGQLPSSSGIHHKNNSPKAMKTPALGAASKSVNLDDSSIPAASIPNTAGNSAIQQGSMRRKEKESDVGGLAGTGAYSKGRSRRQRKSRNSDDFLYY